MILLLELVKNSTVSTVTNVLKHYVHSYSICKENYNAYNIIICEMISAIR